MFEKLGLNIIISHFDCIHIFIEIKPEMNFVHFLLELEVELYCTYLDKTIKYL